MIKLMSSKQNITIQGPVTGQAAICEPILRSLPEWFGIESSIRDFVIKIDRLPTLVAWRDKTPIGFLTVELTGEYAAEVLVMGVLSAYHRQGIGRRLMEVIENHLRKHGVEFLQVKTLSDTHPDLFYKQTRAFYCDLGFRRLEEFPTLWGADSPCVQMIKRLQ